jgi:hypothetical protein
MTRRFGRLYNENHQVGLQKMSLLGQAVPLDSARPLSAGPRRLFVRSEPANSGVGINLIDIGSSRSDSRGDATH